MTTTIDQALGEFIEAWKAGRRPDVDDCLARVPEGERDELAAALSTWLEIAPTPDYDEAALAQIAAEPALAAALDAAALDDLPVAGRVRTLRERAGLSLTDLAASVVERFKLGAPDAESRTAGYLEELEREELNPARLSRRLVEGLAAVLGARPDALAAWGAPPPAPGVVYQRSEEHAGDAFVEEIEALSDAAMASAPKELDEIDRLFLGGPAG